MFTLPPIKIGLFWHRLLCQGAQALVDRITEVLGINPGMHRRRQILPVPAAHRRLRPCVMTINDDVYGRLTEKDVIGILKKYMD